MTFLAQIRENKTSGRENTIPGTENPEPHLSSTSSSFAPWRGAQEPSSATGLVKVEVVADFSSMICVDKNGVSSPGSRKQRPLKFLK